MGLWDKWMVEINIWELDSKDGLEERNSYLGINIVVDKKEWKYCMGDLFFILER